MRGTAVLLALCATVLFAGPAPASDLTAEDLAKVTSLTDAFVKAVNAADWDAVEAMYTEDAFLMPPHAPILQGRPSIRQFFESFPKVTDFECSNLAIQGNGDMVYVVGMYSMMIHVEGMDPVRDDGKYLDVRRKQEDGSWAFVADIFNTSVPAE